jgi:hypothetical protein
MAQANLLELAKQGNPQAIAALMNLVLEPKGVTAKTQLQDDCLHIVFTSEHTLSQSAIASFVRNGLSTLGHPSFQQVKLYARKNGQTDPLWVESFVTGTAARVAPTAHTPPPPAAPKPARVQTHLPNLNPPSPPPPTTSLTSAKPRPTPVTPAQPGLVQKLQQGFQQFWQSSTGWATVPHPYKVAIAVSAGAFFIGGSVALLANSQAGNTVQSGVPASTGSTSPSSQAIVPPMAVQPDTSPAAQVEAYLANMNQAQQAFYQTNGRFATTLEELERSASVLSHSTAYTYRLVLRDNVQSVLTATPKQAELSSYSGTVLPVDATQPTTMATIICKTNQPSTYPPILAQATGQPILCPADSSPIAN